MTLHYLLISEHRKTASQPARDCWLQCGKNVVQELYFISSFFRNLKFDRVISAVVPKKFTIMREEPPFRRKTELHSCVT